MTTTSSTVLLVEDNPIDVEMVSRALQSAERDYRVEVVSCLSSATDFLDEHRPDIILLDLGLPDGAGVQCVTEILDHCQEIPLIVLTNWDEVFTKRILEAGAGAYLPKADVPDRGLESLMDRLFEATNVADLHIEPVIASVNTNASASARSSITPSKVLTYTTRIRQLCGELLIDYPDVEANEKVREIAKLAKIVFDTIAEEN